jgi:hypothetical protein
MTMKKCPALFDLVGLDDVRVVETRGEAGFVDEHRGELVVLGELFLQLLDDDELAEAARTLRRGQVNDRHSPSAELRDRTIFSECLGRGHRRAG